MLFKKSEPKRWHPTISLVTGALTVIGAVTVVSAARNLAGKVRSKMSSICSWRRSDSATPCCPVEEDDQY